MYRNEDYKSVHERIIEDIKERNDYPRWVELLANETDSHKRDIIKSRIARIKSYAKNISN